MSFKIFDLTLSVFVNISVHVLWLLLLVKGNVRTKLSSFFEDITINSATFCLCLELFGLPASVIFLLFMPTCIPWNTHWNTILFFSSRFFYVPSYPFSLSLYYVNVSPDSWFSPFNRGGIALSPYSCFRIIDQIILRICIYFVKCCLGKWLDCSYWWDFEA